MSEAQESAPHVDPKVQRDRQLLMDAHAGGTGATLWTYIKLSGPGWLQSAITLGGGTLGTALYLGVVAGYDFLWLQPLMMILGVIMLSAIAYVTLSTGERPFGAINRHINPVLGWGSKTTCPNRALWRSAVVLSATPGSPVSTAGPGSWEHAATSEPAASAAMNE